MKENRAESEQAEQIYSPKEACVLLGRISRSTLYRIVSRGELGHYRLSPTKIAFSRKHLSEYLRAREVQPTAVPEIKVGEARHRHSGKVAKAA